MKPGLVIFTLFFILCAVLSAFADTSIKAEADKKKLSTDEVLTYKVTITSTEKKIPVPEMPKFEGFSVLSRAQSSNVSLSAGEMKSTLVYAFVLMPLETGALKIPPVSIKIEDKTYSSEPVEIEVTQGKLPPKTAPQEGPSLPESPSSEEKQPQITL